MNIRRQFEKVKRDLPKKKKCKYCHSKENLTYDHKIPIIKGGTNDIKNIQVLCEDCNYFKSNLTDGEVKRLIKWARSIDLKRSLTKTTNYITNERHNNNMERV